MGNCTIILGKSGSGKSSSIKTLDPKETVVINVLKKKLPFKGSQTLYNADNKNLLNVDDYTQVISMLQYVDKSMPNVKTIVLDDIIYVMRKEYFKRAKESGYGKTA